MDIIQVLIIVGIIIFAVVKQLLTSGEEKKKQQHPPMKLPQMEDEDTEEEFSGRTAPEPFLSYDYELPSSSQATKRSSSKKSTRKTEAPTSPLIQEEPENEQEFNIRSAEEVRRAIIWSEILNRKY